MQREDDVDETNLHARDQPPEDDHQSLHAAASPR
jgi:hypothetical protein